MNPPLPTSIGGYQHLEPDVITEPEDLCVQDCGRPVRFVGEYSGKLVGKFEDGTGWRVYRRIPVAKQSDSHERDVAAVAQRPTNPAITPSLPTTPADRKRIPIATGFIDYFPLAIAEIAKVSLVGNDQHNPGKPLHWDRSKSGDESDALMRHFLERGKLDSDGQRHSAKLAWRAMALLEKELEGQK